MARGSKGSPGRPSLLTPELTKAICDQIEICVPDKYAAEANGISERTFQLWMQKGAAEVAPEFSAFFAAVSRARAKAVANMHVRGLAGGKGSSAALWMLERRYWREYAPHQRVEISSPDPLAGLNDDDLEKSIAEQRDRVKQYERVRSLLNRPPSSGEAPEGE